MKRISIFDTTLRDGEQSAHFSLNQSQKIDFALILELLGVDVIEVGFPSSSMAELNTIKEICNVVKKSTICVASRLKKEDVLICSEALEMCKKKRISLILPSNLYSNKDINQLILQIQDVYSYATIFFSDIQIIIQDATRISQKHLFKIVDCSVELGVKTLSIADTVGITTPIEFGKLFKTLKSRFIKKNVQLSAHCHNDLGLAVANSLSAIENGATQVECTILGVGERAGNTSLEEIAAILHIKKELGFITSINVSMLFDVCKKFSEISEFKMAKNKAIIGENIFSHKSGIHQKSILDNPNSFEPFDINTFGIRNRKFIVGKYSGSYLIKRLLATEKMQIDNDMTEEEYISLIKEGEILIRNEFTI